MVQIFPHLLQGAFQNCPRCAIRCKWRIVAQPMHLLKEHPPTHTTEWFKSALLEKAATANVRRVLKSQKKSQRACLFTTDTWQGSPSYDASTRDPMYIGWLYSRPRVHGPNASFNHQNPALLTSHTHYRPTAFSNHNRSLDHHRRAHYDRTRVLRIEQQWRPRQ